MGIGGIGIWQLLIILVLVILIFGTKKLKNVGGDLGSAIKNFKSSMKEGNEEAPTTSEEPPQLSSMDERVIDGEKVEQKDKV